MIGSLRSDRCWATQNNHVCKVAKGPGSVLLSPMTAGYFQVRRIILTFLLNLCQFYT